MKVEKNACKASEIVPETISLHAVEGLWLPAMAATADGVPFA
jgi:hypothetical protein